jgi:hypothetical protein
MGKAYIRVKTIEEFRYRPEIFQFKGKREKEIRNKGFRFTNE